MSALVQSALPNEPNEGKGYRLCMPGLGQGIWDLLKPVEDLNPEKAGNTDLVAAKALHGDSLR